MTLRRQLCLTRSDPGTDFVRRRARACPLRLHELLIEAPQEGVRVGVRHQLRAVLACSLNGGD